MSLLSFEPFLRDDIYACIYHFRIRLPKTFCISASYADLSPSKNFFSRHLSPDKTRKSHLDFPKAVDRKINKNCLIAQVPHPLHDCIYDDIRSAYLGGRVKLKPAVRQYEHLKEEGFPENYGLYENNLMLRKHNDPSVIKISELWWREYETYSNRDQFSLSYVYWKYQFKPDYFFENKKNARNVDCIKYHEHILRGSWLRRNPILRFFARNARIAIRYILMKIHFD